MLMLALAPSTSTDFLSIFDAARPLKSNKMLVSSCFSSTPAFFADDSGFFDDDSTPIASSIGIEIGHKLTAMCDDFDAELSAFRSRPPRSLLDRVFDFFAF